MNVYIYYDASSITIITKNEKPCNEISRLGLKVFSAEAIHLGRDVRYIAKSLRRLGYKNNNLMLDRIAASIRTRTNDSIELYCR